MPSHPLAPCLSRPLTVACILAPCRLPSVAAAAGIVLMFSAFPRASTAVSVPSSLDCLVATSHGVSRLPSSVSVPRLTGASSAWPGPRVLVGGALWRGSVCVGDGRWAMVCIGPLWLRARGPPPRESLCAAPPRAWAGPPWLRARVLPPPCVPPPPNAFGRSVVPDSWAHPRGRAPVCFSDQQAASLVRRPADLCPMRT